MSILIIVECSRESNMEILYIAISVAAPVLVMLIVVFVYLRCKRSVLHVFIKLNFYAAGAGCNAHLTFSIFYVRHDYDWFPTQPH